MKGLHFGWMIALALAPAALAQTISPEGGFEVVKEIPATVAQARANVRPDRFTAVKVRWNELKKVLDEAPLEDTADSANNIAILSLPRPDGTWESFSIVDSPIMEAGLAARFPEIRTFAGQGLDHPQNTVRFDYTPHGFHAQVFTEDGSYYIDPYSFGDTTYVSSYWKRDCRSVNEWQCHVDDSTPVAPPATPSYTDRAIVTRRQIRLAVATTVEYTAYHGGTQALGQSAVVTAINRVNQIYERDVAVRFVLVANNQNLIYVTSDNYANNGSTNDLTANQTNCDSVIGSANYDLGHLFQTGNGGVVGQIGAYCSATQKGRGLSGFPTPINDPFVIDYVAHEMGHQSGGRHCFNNCGGSAGDAQTYAYEPGSGVTIMAYAGICGSTNVQSNSDAMFHSGSLDLISAFIAGITCDAETVTTNNTPTVNGGLDYTIPKQTPFTLTAVGSDIDGDTLTYSWEQRDTATGTVALGTDNGVNPIQRTWLPTSSPSRTIPRLSNLIANTTATGEILPQVARTLRYRVVVRDNKVSNGGYGFDDVVLTVNGTAGPFAVTAPNAAGSLSGNTTVTWSVASTNIAPVSCANVKISLSTDGGNTYPTVLLASTPNDGSELVTLPNITTSTARIKVESVGNIFFDISNANFSITPSTPTVNFAGVGVNTITDSTGNGNANGVIDPGESDIGVTVRIVNNGSLAASGVSGTLSSLTPTVTVTSAVSSYPNMSTGVQVNNNTPFRISISPTHSCGAPINLRLNINSGQGTGSYDFTLTTGATSGSGTQTFTYTGAATAIPDNTSTGVSVPLTVSGLVGPITDLNFRFNGTTCNATAGSTTVGLDHSWVGDLIVTLVAPSGASCVVIDRPGVPATTTGNGGNNFCNTVMDDQATTALEGAAATSAPFTGSWTPSNPLSVFNGLNANGTWTLKVADLASADTGSIRSFSLVITSSSTVCTPPSNPCAADFNDDGSVDGDDVIGFFGAWDAANSSADFNGDGSVDGDDVIGFFMRWDAGC